VVFRKGSCLEVQWAEVVVGDICRVKEGELFPADLILLATENKDGTAFIETASLDGEKNLKPRTAYAQTQVFAQEDRLQGLAGTWDGSVPDKHTENFQSSLSFEGTRVEYKKEKQLLWRGTRLMNTKWIYGLVIYTGRNTKILQNS
jgi:phospholipid-transporting ATPase